MVSTLSRDAVEFAAAIVESSDRKFPHERYRSCGVHRSTASTLRRRVVESVTGIAGCPNTGCHLRPENRDRYPANWQLIREDVLVRAFNQCEGSPDFPRCRAENGQPHPETGSKVVLTIAHLDHTPENCDPTNLKAWCQRCHLNYDREHHAQTAYATRREGKAVADLFNDDDAWRRP